MRIRVNLCESVWIRFGHRLVPHDLENDFLRVQWKGAVWICVKPCEFILSVYRPSRCTNDFIGLQWKGFAWILVNSCEFVLGAAWPITIYQPFQKFNERVLCESVWIRVNLCESVWIRLGHRLAPHDLANDFTSFQWKGAVWICVNPCEFMWIRLKPCEFILSVYRPSRCTNDFIGLQWKGVVWILVNSSESVWIRFGRRVAHHDLPTISEVQWKGVVWICMNPCESVWIRVNSSWAPPGPSRFSKWFH